MLLFNIMRAMAGIAFLLTACGGESAGDDTSNAVGTHSDWVRIEASCGYSFEAPPEIVWQPAGGTDSCRNAWSVASCRYDGDYGAFSNDLSSWEELPEYQQVQQVIDGRNARVITALSGTRSLAAVQFQEVDPEVEGLQLTLWAECEDEVGQRDAVAAFESVEFEP